MNQAGIQTSWNEWIELKQRGWKTAWIQIDEMGRVSLGAIPPDGVIVEEAEAMNKNKSKRTRPAGLAGATQPKSPLTARLRLLISLAWRQPGQVASITLNNGLRLDLVAESNGAYRLLLARRGVFPSTIELATTLNHWPDPVPDVTPEPLEHGEWKCLKVGW